MCMSILFYIFPISIVTATTTSTKDVFSKNSNVRVSKKWLEAGQTYADDFRWVNVTSVLSTFISPVVLLSLPEFGGSSYSSGLALSVRIKNLKVGSGGLTSFQLKVSLLSHFVCIVCIVEHFVYFFC
jgi:hypothetical protein